MAFGIDDFLATTAAGVNLADTLVRTIQNNSGGKNPGDVEDLIAEVKIAAISHINDAQLALNKFERTLMERGVDLNRPLHEIINDTPFWRPFENFRLSQAKRSIDYFSDSVYRSCDDIAALLRCTGETQGMGAAIVESNSAKREFSQRILNARSVKETIELLRDQLDRQKVTLSN